MGNEIINELTNLDIVDLIYVNRTFKKGTDIVTYNIICNINSIVEDIDIFKRIVAIMEVLKELIGVHNIAFNYNIKTSNALEDDIANENKRVINDLNNASILYSKDDYFTDMIKKKKKK